MSGGISPYSALMSAGSRRNEEAAFAAERLRHDLGKAVRFSAPEALEPDTEELRARLARDVAAPRSGPEGPRSAAAIFDDWSAGSARLFADSPAAGSLRRIARAIEEVRGLSGRLAELPRPELERLDALTRAIAEECRVLAAGVRTPEGP